MLKRCLFFFIVVAAVGVLFPLPAHSNLFSKVFMPGKLNAYHAKYEDDCRKCHSSFRKSASQRRLCLDCHKKVAKDIDEKTGFHGHNKRIDLTECNHCHTEHKGRKFDIMVFDKDLFNHEITDFLLKGRHMKARCESCHAPATKYRDARHLCIDCHEKGDFHEGRLGKECADCHDEGGWSHYRFDHNKTEYPLKGKHEKVTCISCHPEKRYKGSPVDCYACHRGNDVHGGGYTKNCIKCHTAAGWKKSIFNHEKIDFVGKLKISDCYSCHRASDVHKRRLGTLCRKCHTAKKWKPVRFDHGKTKFTLVEKHIDVECEACHTLPLSTGKTPKECIGCHQNRDEHNGLYGEKCESCHSVKEWKGPVFDHAKTKFKLEDKHEKVACPLCHKGNLYEDKTETTCRGCHRFDDAHKTGYGPVCAPCHTAEGWDKPVFDHEKSILSEKVSRGGESCPSCYLERLGKACFGCHKADDIHNEKEGRECESCHNTKAWSEKIFFEHDMTDFPLVGLHSVVSCEGCHLDAVFKGVTVECIDCHKKDDVHEGRMGKECLTCHNPNGWSFWIFNHARQSKFPLDGAHEDLECIACHKEPLNREKPLPVTCVSCHRKESIHLGRYWRNCDNCHITKSFKDIVMKK